VNIGHRWRQAKTVEIGARRTAAPIFRNATPCMLGKPCFRKTVSINAPHIQKI